MLSFRTLIKKSKHAGIVLISIFVFTFSHTWVVCDLSGIDEADDQRPLSFVLLWIVEDVDHRLCHRSTRDWVIIGCVCGGAGPHPCVCCRPSWLQVSIKGELTGAAVTVGHISTAPHHCYPAAAAVEHVEGVQPR